MQGFGDVSPADGTRISGDLDQAIRRRSPSSENEVPTNTCLIRGHPNVVGRTTRFHAELGFLMRFFLLTRWLPRRSGPGQKNPKYPFSGTRITAIPESPNNRKIVLNNPLDNADSGTRSTEKCAEYPERVTGQGLVWEGSKTYCLALLYGFNI